VGADDFHRLPEEVTVPVAELRIAIGGLEAVLDELLQRPDAADLAAGQDVVIGQMSRWLWPLLRDLDEEDGS
jgi:hypothetical protein